MFLGGMIIEVGEFIVGVDFSSRTPYRRTLELVERIGHRSLWVLVDSGPIGNYSDARVCTARGIKVEVEDQAKGL